MANPVALVKFEDYFGITMTSFRSIGLNPYFEDKKPSSMIRRLLNFTLFQFLFWVLGLCTSLEVVFFCSIMGDKSQLLDFCRCLSCALFGVMALEEMLLMWFSGHKFNEFILQLEQMFPNDGKTQQKYAIDKQASGIIIILKNLASVFCSCIFIWVAGSPTYDILVAWIAGKRYVFELPFKMWSPWDLNQAATFYIALFLECVTVYGSVMIILAVNTFFVSIVAQICLQFDMLAQNIREMQSNNMHRSIELTLMHIRLIEISQRFAKLISRTVFVNHIVSSVALCCGLFLVVTTTDTSDIFRFVVYLLCVLIQTFNLSFIGDILIEHSQKIPLAIYDSDWLSNNKRMRLTLLQMMHRSQKPLVVTGMGFFIISLPSFTRILTTSFSYFALLNSMMKKK